MYMFAASVVRLFLVAAGLEASMSPNHFRTVIAVALIAGVVLLWAFVTLGLGKPWLSFPHQKEVLAVLWALGPPAWFYAEYKIWGRNEQGLASGQQYARDFWVGAGALVPYLVTK
jgi:hypothetical protein